MKTTLIFAAFFTLTTISACSDSDTPSDHDDAPAPVTQPQTLQEPKCIPGTSAACSCTNGATGAQTCDDAGDSFNPCICEVSQPTPVVAPATDLPLVTLNESGSFFLQPGQVAHLIYGTLSKVTYTLTYYGPGASGTQEFSANVTEEKDGVRLSFNDLGGFGLNSSSPDSPNTVAVRVHLISANAKFVNLSWGVYLY